MKYKEIISERLNAKEKKEFAEKERLKNSEIKEIEKKIDNLFSRISVDVEFTNHFKGRVKFRKIQRDELIGLFTKLFKKHKSKLNKDNFTALVYDVSKFLNIPINIEWSEAGQEFDLKAITALKTKEKPKKMKKGDELLKV